MMYTRHPREKKEKTETKKNDRAAGGVQWLATGLCWTQTPTMGLSDRSLLCLLVPLLAADSLVKVIDGST